MLTVDGGGAEDVSNFDLVIISSRNQFYQKMKFVESKGVPRNRILDGYVFKVPNLDFPRFLKEGVAYGVFDNKNSFSDNTSMIYPRVYNFKNDSVTTIKLGAKSRVNNSFYGIPVRIEGNGIITFGNFSAMAWGGLFQLGLNGGHNHQILTSYCDVNFDWAFPRDFRGSSGVCKINIGSDVWIGRGCTLKCANYKKPLVIGDGAAIASDSVVVKNVPPYAIVGGNPANVIKYRFPPHVIKALLRIKWWDWSLDKIHDNFKYFNDVEKFISLHDPLKDSDTPEDEKILSYDIENTFDLDTDKIRNNFR